MDWHKSVMLKEVLEFLKVRKDQWYVDCTLGDGGYSLGIIQQGGKVIGIDHDQASLDRAKQRFDSLGIDMNNYIFKKGNFRDLKDLVDRQVAGMVFDLGVSSNQLDDGLRGFSFSKDAELDMRMDQDLGVKALDLVNGLNKGELEKLFTVYGEITDKRVARAIIEARAKGPITTTTQLAKVIVDRLGMGHKKIHPATLVFQALRIAVNDELNSLKQALPEALELLESGGRLVTVSFHSLEDRIVKNSFREFDTAAKGVILTDKPLNPSALEVFQNPRARSAILRVMERI